MALIHNDFHQRIAKTLNAVALRGIAWAHLCGSVVSMAPLERTTACFLGDTVGKLTPHPG